MYKSLREQQEKVNIKEDLVEKFKQEINRVIRRKLMETITNKILTGCDT